VSLFPLVAALFFTSFGLFRTFADRSPGVLFSSVVLADFEAKKRKVNKEKIRNNSEQCAGFVLVSKP
jgi:hypothetical protein